MLKIEENNGLFVQQAIKGLLNAKERLESYFVNKEHNELAKIVHNLAIAYYCEGQEALAIQLAHEAYAMKRVLIENGKLRTSQYNFIQTERLVQQMESKVTVQEMEFNF